MLLSLSVTVAAAQQATGSGAAKRPRVVFDEDTTPLQRALEQTVKDKRGRMRDTSEACLMALEELEALERRERDGDEIDPKEKKRLEKQVAAKCKIPRVKMEKFGRDKCPDCGDKVNPAGKVVGKKIVTETTLDFDTPDQRERAKWAELSFPGRLFNPRAGQGLGDGTGTARLRNAGLFGDSSSNDDKDCIDVVTSRRRGGLDPSTGTVIPDGDPESCFDDNGELKSLLEEIEGGCRHTESGETFSGDATDGIADDCYDENGVLRITLEELVDEDPSETGDDDGDGLEDEDPPGDANDDGNPNDDDDCVDLEGTIQRGPDCTEASGELVAGFRWLVDEDGKDQIDQDGDGHFDEDPPAQSDATAACEAAGGDPIGMEGCDLSRAVIVHANQQAMKKHKKKIFKADDKGNCDNQMPGEVECGAEARRVKLTETFVVRCPSDAEFVNGECRTPLEPASATGPEPASTSSAPSRSAAEGTSSPPVPFTAEAMMGFTFAPPVLEWGYKIQEEACVDLGLTEICVEVFFARVGYEFDLAAGLRLPVKVTVDDIPSRNDIPFRALAEDVHTLRSSLEPLDFSAKQFEDFCTTHRLHEEPFIGNCKRFSFPEFFSELLAEAFPAEFEKDGSEFVAQAVVFAGLQVRVLSIPVINFGVDVNLNLPAICTVFKIFNLLDDDPQLNLSLVNFGKDLANSKSVLQALKDSGLNCASFTTPWGDSPDPVTQVPRLRTFPLAGNLTIPADCAQALVEGPKVKVKGKERPVCTGLLVGAHGASMGVDLGLELAFGSTLITAEWGAKGDAQRPGSLDPTAFYQDLLNEDPTQPELGPVTFNNFSAAGDFGVVTLDDFNYLLNAFQLRLSAKLGFGGILSPIPDIAEFTLLTIVFSGGSLGAPIPQHAGTEPIELEVFVETYGLDVEAGVRADDEMSATPATPRCVNQPMLKIRPGEGETPGTFLVAVENLGSVPDTFKGFRAAVSECPAAEACADENKQGWSFQFDPLKTLEIRAHTKQEAASTLAVRPVLNFETGPGEYWLKLSGDSATVRDACDAQPPAAECLKEPDPLGNPRLGAEDDFCVQVLAVWNPQVAIEEVSGPTKPGVALGYTARVTNAANAPDTIGATQLFLDSNTAGCGLAERGRDRPGCRYRAETTRIQDGWVADPLARVFRDLEPGDSAPDEFSMQTEAEWAGMEDTTYEIEITVDSRRSALDQDWLRDKGGPATAGTVVGLTVAATLKSMTNYIGLEIDELIEILEGVEEVGTGGLGPLVMHPVKMNNETAKEHVHEGNLEAARRAHARSMPVVGALLRMLDGGIGRSLPTELEMDLRLRANALLEDLSDASTSDVAPADCLVDDLVVSGTPSENPAVFQACRTITWGPGEFNNVSGMVQTHILVDGFVSSGDSTWSNP